MDYRTVGFWFDSIAADEDGFRPRPGLDADADVDVTIVGAGLTGLWTAYYLQERDPSLRILLLEKEVAGFGASGRNGGWCSSLFPWSASKLDARYGRDAAVGMRQAMVDTVDEVGRVAETEGVDIDFARGGTVTFARSKPQVAAARAEFEESERYGVDRVALWGTETVRSRFGVRDALAATYTPACARIHPAKLVRGLARVVERRGATIAEGTEVLSWDAGTVQVRSGGSARTVRAGTVVNATEGYGSQLPQVGRRILPLYSLMIATEPLPDATWERIGIEHGQTFTDFRNLIVYGQRTADNRFAFGGRGARYHLGSAIRPGHDRSPRVRDHLIHTLYDLFPDAAGARITHHWGGPLGVPRDWHASVGYDRDAREAWAGGYVGDGLSTTNLAGRTLADLLTGSRTDLTMLPWVGHRSPRWEPEPLRFAGANAGLVAMESADLEESVTRRASVIARTLSPLIGH
ncbi:MULTISPECIES: NAD(P)/FAD-dependent oxidoreductase [unclassified Leifsonia]|uniref:NAD(P)/FAD-dependent oxidoreductase n=1 Tax=unclassified Leifsonia TaxID=2663824 RepID=UPI0003659A01|nr:MULTISPECIES: FAD-dependent oxidoreductase [unclassified Leifsonia]TDQ03652.1 glycine/D-amino acid oxidase-like deaminating enzyme [Leifsonia sp. 115AMFTsu3.1]